MVFDSFFVMILDIYFQYLHFIYSKKFFLISLLSICKQFIAAYGLVVHPEHFGTKL